MMPPPPFSNFAYTSSDVRKIVSSTTYPEMSSILVDILVLNCTSGGCKTVPDLEELTACNSVARGTLPIACLTDHKDPVLLVASAI